MSLIDGHTARSHIARNPRTGRFLRGNKAYRARQVRIAEKLEALRETYDSRSAGHMALLATAAVHLCDADLARSKVSCTRSTNSALKLLALVPKLVKPPSLDDILSEAF
jgi:hypothetical protein